MKKYLIMVLLYKVRTRRYDHQNAKGGFTLAEVLITLGVIVRCCCSNDTS